MSAASSGPSDFRLVFHPNLSHSYELSKCLLATAGFDGTLQLLTSGWEKALGYGRAEIEAKTLGALIGRGERSVAATATAILDVASIRAVGRACAAETACGNPSGCIGVTTSTSA